MKVIVSWSGGKDSQACLIWAAEKFGAKNIEAVFCDTCWEHKDTDKHVRLIPELLGVKLVVLKSSVYDGLVDLAIKRNRFPSARARFCTTELKIKPMIDYVLSHNDNVLVIQGIRAEESKSRSKMSKECTYFKYYTEPYSYDKKGKPRFETYRKEDVAGWQRKFFADILRPLFDWDANKVINYILQNNLPMNPQYYKGAKRVGCWPCVMCVQLEITNIIFNEPERIDEIRSAERISGNSFFPPDYIPKRYCSKVDSKGNKYPCVDDVVRYIKDKHATGDLFKEMEEKEKKHSNRKCMSAYSICE